MQLASCQPSHVITQGRRHHRPVPTGLQADTGVDHAMHKKGVERSLFYLLEPSVLGIY